MAGVGSSGGSVGSSTSGASGWLIPPSQMASRISRTYTIQIPTASAFTHVADMPTTRAELVLHNGDRDMTFMIDKIWWMSLTSIAAAAAATIVSQVKLLDPPTDNTAILVSSPYGKPYNGFAKKALGVTTFVANMWEVAMSGVSGPTASIGLGMVAEANGRIMLKPGYSLGVNVVVGTAAGTGVMGISWCEQDIPVYS